MAGVSSSEEESSDDDSFVGAFRTDFGVLGGASKLGGATAPNLATGFAFGFSSSSLDESDELDSWALAAA